MALSWPLPDAPRWVLLGGVLLLAGAPRLPAQAALTAADIAPHLDVLAADSMRDRGTPSPALERTAQYIAAQWQQLGLDAGITQRRKEFWVWHYPVPGQLTLNAEQSQLVFQLPLQAGGHAIAAEDGDPLTREVAAGFATAAHFVADVGPPKVVLPRLFSFFDIRATGSERVLVIAGRQTAASVGRLPVQGAVVIYLPVATDSAVQAQILRRLYETSEGVVVSPNDSSAFAVAMARARPQRIPVVDAYLRLANGPHAWPWVAEVSPALLHRVLEVGGLDVARLRSDTAPTVQTLSQAAVWLRPKADSTIAPVRAPVVAAILPGRDSLLRREYVVISATMDAIPPPTGSADSSMGGGGDLGPAGLVALARAFSRPGERPRRSVLFLATSGGAGGKPFWGTNAYLAGSGLGYRQTAATTVADLDLDRLGVPVGDSVLVDGLQEVDLVPRLEWVLAQHPEIGVAARDGGTVLQPTSGQFPFVQFGIPSLSFHTGMHADGVADSNMTAGVRAERVLPVLRLVAQVAKTIADAESPIRWSTEAHARLVDLLGK